MEQAGFALVETFGVERVWKTIQFVVEVVAVFVDERAQEGAEGDDGAVFDSVRIQRVIAAEALPWAASYRPCSSPHDADGRTVSTLTRSGGTPSRFCMPRAIFRQTSSTSFWSS
jgi:hypothetical protein